MFQTPASATTLSVGLDVDGAAVAVCLLCADRTEIGRRHKIRHDPPGVARLVDTITAAAAAHGCTALRIGMEATGGLEQPLARTLAAAPALQAFAPQLFVCNPREVEAYRRSLPPQAVTDFTAAATIADFVRDGRARFAWALAEQQAGLQCLTRQRLALVESQVQEKNRLLTFMFLKFSGLRQANPLSKAFGATTLALLTEFHTLDELAALDVPALAAFLREHGRGRIADVEHVAQALLDLAAASYRLPPGLIDPVNTGLTLTCERLTFYASQLTRLDRQIDQAVARAYPDAATALRSVPGLGPVWVAGLLAEIGDVRRFRTQAALANFAGLVWHGHQSGTFTAEDRRLTSSGNRYLRYYLVEGANSVRVHAEEYRAYYQRKYAETPRHAHLRALVLTARKLVRLVHDLLTTGQVYQRPTTRKERGPAPIRS